MRKIIATLLTAALCFVLFAGLQLSAAETNVVGTSESVITLLPAAGTPSEQPDSSSSNPFGIKETHGVTYWNFGGGGNGRYVTYVFDAPVSGDYYLAINYNSKNARTLLVTVNDGATQTLSFVQNSSQWGDNTDASTVNWNYHVVKIPLVKGSNRLVLGMNGTSGAPMFSELKFWPSSEWLTAGDNPTVVSATVVESASGFDSTGYDVGQDAGSISWDLDIAVPGTYKVSVAYSTSSGVANRPIEVIVDGTVVASMARAKNSTAYGNGWSFVTSDEIALEAGAASIGMQVAGSAYIGAVRLELVKSALPDSQMKDLTVTYDGLESAGTVYSVDVSWENDDFTFNYVAGEQGAWNPADHTFADTANAGWEDDDLVVTVVNHSNAAVKVTMEVTDGDAADGLTVTSDKATETLATAEGTAVADAPKVEYTLTIDGTPSESVTKVAIATLTFTKAE